MNHIDYRTFHFDFDHDIPIAYAVFEPIWDADKKQVCDSRYIYVNEKYCLMVRKTKEELMGKRLSECYDELNLQWFDFCYEAVVLGKTIRQRTYSPEIHRWVEFEVSPISIPGLCAYTFLDVDDEMAKSFNLTRAYKMDNIIIELTSILVNPKHYETAIQQALEKLSEIIHPDRIYILETDGTTISNTFEWCRQGVPSAMEQLQNLPCGLYMNTWNRYLQEDSSIIIEDIEKIKKDDPLVYDLLDKQHIRRLINAPIYDDDTIIGYVGVDNYVVNEELDMKHILESVAFFLGAKMVKEKLLRRLDFLSHYDVLTGVHNRNALMVDMEKLEETDTSVGILYIDDNGLKRLNDTYGHFYGDMHIKKTAELLMDCFGKDHVYRAGGDEFVVLVPGVEKVDFEKHLSTYQEKLAQEPELSVAMGSEWIGQAKKQLKAAIHRADQKMYEDKEAYYRNHGTGR